MKPLPLRPLPIQTEPLTDYLERLGGANGYRGRELWQVLSKRQSQHEEILSSALNGHPFPRFSGPSVPGIEIPVELFGLQSVDFIHRRQRWCPVCIQDAAWFRPVWRLKVATTCALHRIQLLQSCPRCKSDPAPHSILSGVCECGIHFAKSTNQASRGEILVGMALETSLSQVATFDLEEAVVQLNTAQLIRMICYVGRFVEGPSLSRPGKVRELEDISVASNLVAGTAALLADWPAAYWHCLDRFVRAAPDDASVRRVFGSLYHVIYQDLKDPTFQFFRDAFELFLLEHWRGELCGRHRLFQQKTIQSYSNRGLARVARMTGIGSETLKRMVHQDCIPANCFTGPSRRQFITIDSTQLSEFLPNPGDYLDLRSAARLLGIKRTRLRELVATGVILADAKPDWSRSNRWFFRRSRVCEFMTKIRQVALSELPNAETVTLNHALRHWRVTAAELGALLTDVRQGEMPFMLGIKDQLRGIIFDEMALHDWLDRFRKSTSDSVTPTAAANLLGLKEQVVYELISKNLLQANLVSKNGRLYKRISRPSLERFREEYVSLTELAHDWKIYAGSLLKRLEVKPVTGPKIDGGRQYFYRRSDLPAEFTVELKWSSRLRSLV